MFKFIDLFSGIGGFRIPLEELGGKCVGYSEVDKKAIATYRRNFKTCSELLLGDATRLASIPQVDLVTGGVPCQPWSIAGKSGGFNDVRGMLWFDTIMLIANSQPKAFIFENVKGLTEPRHKVEFETILSKLTYCGYQVKWQVLNSYDFGLPQVRERVYIVGFRDDLANNNSFIFPQPNANHPSLYEFFPSLSFNENDYHDRNCFTFSDVRDGLSTIHTWDIYPTTERQKLICQTILKNRRKKLYGSQDGNPMSYVQISALMPTLQELELTALVDKSILKQLPDARYEFINSKVSSGIGGTHRIILPHATAISTLTATGSKDFIATQSFKLQEHLGLKQSFLEAIYHPKHFAPLTDDCYRRLQGFPDWFQDGSKPQYGNAVSVPVVRALAERLVPMLD